MDTRKPPDQFEARQWLQNGRLTLPPLRFQLARVQPQYSDGAAWDFEVQALWSDQSATFAVECKSLSTPKAFDEALRQCSAAVGVLPQGCYPLILMPYLRESQLKELERQEVSGLDWCGNGVVIVPGKFRVFRTGSRNQFSTYAPIKNIYRKNTSMVARVLLTASRFSSVRDILAEIKSRDVLAKTTGKTPMSLGTVSKALKQLDDELIIDRDQGIRLLQGDKLLDQLEQNYQPLKTANRVRLKVDCPFDQLPRVLSAPIDEQTGPLVAATGISSVSRYATMQREEVLSLYCPKLTSAQAAIGGRETDRFPNLELIETSEQSLYFDARSDAGFLWSSPVQTYLELMRGDKRDRETAEQVKDYILGRIGEAN